MSRIACTASLLVVLLLTAGCGDDAPSAASLGQGGTGGKTGTPLTPRELADALQRAQNGAEGSEALRRTLEEQSRTLGEHMGGDITEIAAKLKAFGERALTSADLETFLAVAPKVRGLSSKPGELLKALSDTGLSVPEWGMLTSRIAAARLALKLPVDKRDPKHAPDMEVVKQFTERLDAASRAR